MSSETLNSRTAQGLIDFCDLMANQGYATPNAMEAWKVAARKILTAVEGEDFESTDLTSIDMEDVMGRFQTLTRGQYKPDSVTAYGRRMKNAMDAYFEYLDTGKAPQMRRQAAAPKAEPKPKAPKASRSSSASSDSSGGGDLIKFPFPLKTGEMATLHLPRRIQSDDVERLSGFLRTLQTEPQAQIPAQTSEDEAA